MHTNARWHSSRMRGCLFFGSTVDGINPAPVGYVGYGKHPSVQKGFIPVGAGFLSPAVSCSI